MDALSSITRGRSEANFATRANPEPEAELTPPADDETPEAFNIVEIKDIWSDLEVCRASAAWNLRSYLKQTKPLGSHKDAPEPAALTKPTPDNLIRSNWRAKIDKDDLRHDLLEMKTILDFLASRNNASCMGLPWGVASVLTGLTGGVTTMLLAADPVVTKVVPAIFFGSGLLSLKQCYTEVQEWVAARRCQQVVQELLDAVEDGTLENQNADVLDGGDFRVLLRVGRQ